MKNYIKMAASLLLAGTFALTGCQDDFAEVNVDPSAVEEGNVAYLFSQGILDFEPSDYTYWFFNADAMYQWMQTLVSTSGVSSDIFDGVASPGLKSIDVLKYANEIKWVRSQMEPSEAPKYEHYAKALDVLCIYMGIWDSDFVGNIPYTESANFIHGGTLTPKYDKISDLYDLWLTNLDEAINAFQTAQSQQFDAAQDPIYGGDMKKWAKLANSLKLKIATRLLSQDRARALQIAQDVATASCGYINESADNFLFNKATYNSVNQDKTYHWSNGILQSVGGSQTMIDFLVNNRDPRVRFIYQKNDWSSTIVQLFLENGRKDNIPSYIMANVNLDADGNFESWKIPEPWVRYYGLPLNFNAGQQAADFGDWFNYNEMCKYDDDHTYVPFSRFQQEQVYGRIDFTLPVAPGGKVVKDEADVPWYGMYMTEAEVNLYLAEFALLGASLPQQASVYFDKAVRASVTEYDQVASLNKIPYYANDYDYDPLEAVIDLQDGEIDTMMANEAYQLTGDKASDLEKVYIQQIIHFSLSPIDGFMTSLRSGVPKFGSDIFPRMDYAANGFPASKIPRRVSFSAPSPTDLMYDILNQTYQEQGYSIGGGDILNSERIWQDQNNPQWGAGPQL